MAKTPIVEQPNNPYRLGRILKPDPRDFNFLLPKEVGRSTVPLKIWSVTPPALDQGDTPACVGYSGAKWLQAAPILNPLSNPMHVYSGAQQYDGGPLPHDGSTIRGLMKYLQSKGLVSKYLWAFDLNTVINYVLEQGPMVAGTNWYYNQFYPDRNGNLSVSGYLAGGHAYVLIGADQNHKNRSGANGAFKIQNSWGSSWGVDDGKAWISFKSFGTLLSRQGEVAVATEVAKGIIL